ncbi:maltase 1 [Aplysia californica]|uniref:Maltase 1 n=1 Tax=Aplysia californica TaxID=6500 RepID=A0ABM1A8C1_APLCA|nr:maltase 1 [Aplysia californica]
MKTFCLLLLAALAVGDLAYSESDPQTTPVLPWWKTTIIYQIYPRSFKDSDGDGIGDLQGIISELQHFQYLGVETLWLSPFYKSPQKDFGYDISDQRDVDPMFGSIEDFRKLVAEAKKLGLRTIVDFVPNHTSTDHDWFQKSVRREGKYTDYYVWSDGKTLPNGTVVAPNNWLSVFYGSAWEWNDQRQQYYLHQFIKEQADLNYRNPDVREEILLAMRYWLDFGIDGLRMDAIGQLYEVTDLSLDEPLSGAPGVPLNEYDSLLHPYTNFLPEVKDEIIRWQTMLDGMEKVDGRQRFMVLEYYTDSDSRAKMAEYGAHPFNFDLVDNLDIPTNASQIMALISEEYMDKPASYWPTFVIGNHDRNRVASKYNPRNANAFNMLLLTLKGTPTTYYGEEIAMEDIDVAYNESQDPWGINAGPDRYRLVSRDFNRSPMQWTSVSEAGFTTGKPWLPVNPDYLTVNVASEKLNPKSPLNLYKEYAALRQLNAFKYGDIDVNVITNDNVLSFLREFGSERYLVCINLGQSPSTDDYSQGAVNSPTGVVIATTGNVPSAQDKFSTVSLDSLTLQPGQGLVLKL